MGAFLKIRAHKLGSSSPLPPLNLCESEHVRTLLKSGHGWDQRKSFAPSVDNLESYIHASHLTLISLIFSMLKTNHVIVNTV